MLRKLSPEEVIYKLSFDNIEYSENKEYRFDNNSTLDYINTAFEIDTSGFNMYIVDEFSKEKLNSIMNYIKEILSKKNKPKDICYVIDSANKNPRPIFVSQGKGNQLKKAVEELQEKYLLSDYEFYNTWINEKKENLIINLQNKKNHLVESLMEVAKEEGFILKTNKPRFAFTPIKDGNSVTEKEYDELDEEQKCELVKKASKLKRIAKVVIEEISQLDKEETIKLRLILQEYLKKEMYLTKLEFKEKFQKDEEVIGFLETIYEKIEEDLIMDYTMDFEDDQVRIKEDIFKYKVKVLVDNSNNESPLVIFEEDPNLVNLIGSIGYYSHNGEYTTDVESITAGSIFRGNEGCVIIRASSLISNIGIYHYLKKYLLSGYVSLECGKSNNELLTLNTIKPRPIKIDAKIILIGDIKIYNLLYLNDEDFKNIFKMRLEINSFFDISPSSKQALLYKVKEILNKRGLNAITLEGLMKIAKLFSKKAGDRDRLYIDEEELNKILILANNRANKLVNKVIDSEQIMELINKEDPLQLEILRNYRDKKLLIEIKSSVIGQVNGLSIIDIGYACFGKPMRITCTCEKGSGHIVDAQKESGLSGNIHKKSLNILKGYLSTLFGGYNTLPVDFYLSFEQVYGRVEGDSASIACITSILSALGKIPVKQNLAVTGSINQFGEIQPIGGVNEKIEGFYKICKALEDVKGKGVIIPHANLKGLILCEEVENAVLKGDFYIYVADNVKDAMELLMGKENIMEDILRELKKYRVPEIK
ncbi:MAG: AAA family ATPase [Clostridiaceae bacterium]|nr:AAA family ATPase [Clostridiaceae bacterium]